MTYSSLLFFVIFLLNFLLFHSPCVVRDLEVYGGYFDSQIAREYFIWLAPFIFSCVYSLQCRYLLIYGFSYTILFCYIALTIFTVGVNQLSLSIALTIYLFGIRYASSYRYRLVGILIHPSLLMSLFFKQGANHKTLNFKTILTIISIWLALLSLIDKHSIVDLFLNAPQKNISNFGYYLSVHYSDEGYYNYNKLSGFENVILFAAISFATKRWIPFLYELIAFQTYTLFDTIPQPMGFRLFEIFGYMLLIHTYRDVKVKYSFFVFFIGISVMLYKFGYVFGCFIRE